MTTEEPPTVFGQPAITQRAFISFLGAATLGLMVVRSALAYTRDRPVVFPVTMRTWFDVFASADPVPNGGTRTTEEGWPTSAEVINERCLTRDHTGYWRNRDQFISLVVGVLSSTTTTGLRPRLGKAIEACLPMITER